MSKKIYSIKEVEEAKKDGKHLIIIFDKVYDVGPFLNKHPGGEEVLIDAAGRDATDDFEDIGHSTDAREMMAEFEVGELNEEDKTNAAKRRVKVWDSESSSSSSWTSWLVPIGLAIAASAVYRMVFQSS